MIKFEGNIHFRAKNNLIYIKNRTNFPLRTTFHEIYKIIWDVFNFKLMEFIYDGNLCLGVANSINLPTQPGMHSPPAEGRVPGWKGQKKTWSSACWRPRNVNDQVIYIYKLKMVLYKIIKKNTWFDQKRDRIYRILTKNNTYFT